MFAFSINIYNGWTKKLLPYHIFYTEYEKEIQVCALDGLQLAETHPANLKIMLSVAGAAVAAAVTTTVVVIVQHLRCCQSMGFILDSSHAAPPFVAEEEFLYNLQ